MATARKILPGLEATPALTKRDAWAATFEHVLGVLDAPRTDCPRHLPDAPAPTQLNAHHAEGGFALNDLQRDIASVHAHLAGHPNYWEELDSMQQRDLGTWLEARYDTHSSATRAQREARLKLGSGNWTVSCRFTGTPGWLDSLKVHCGGKGDGVYTLMFLSRFFPALSSHPPSLLSLSLSHLSSACTSTFQTISTNKLKTVGGKNYYCLEWSNTSSTLRTMPCSRSNDPTQNDAPQQHWDVVHGDSTVHPYGRSDLCLTNAVYDEPNNSTFGYTVEVLPCDGSVLQHWGYGGNGGGLVYGSCTSLGLI